MLGKSDVPALAVSTATNLLSKQRSYGCTLREAEGVIDIPGSWHISGRGMNDAVLLSNCTDGMCEMDNPDLARLDHNDRCEIRIAPLHMSRDTYIQFQPPGQTLAESCSEDHASGECNLVPQ